MNGPAAELHAAANIVAGPWAPALSALLAAHAENATGTDEAALSPETAAALRLARDIRGTTTEDVPRWAVEMGERLDRIESLLERQTLPTEEVVRRLRALRVPDEMIERDVYRRAGYSREEC